MTHQHDEVMIDLETMGTDADAAILQIGAVRFNLYTGSVDPLKLLVDVSMESCLAVGASVTRDTVDWWARQGGFKHVGETVQVKSALHALVGFCSLKPQVSRMWCKGPHFDQSILAWYARRLGISLPWQYYQVMDVRTTINLALERGLVLPTQKPTHRADEDCLLQIRQLHQSARTLGVVK